MVFTSVVKGLKKRILDVTLNLWKSRTKANDVYTVDKIRMCRGIYMIMRSIFRLASFTSKFGSISSRLR